MAFGYAVEIVEENRYQDVIDFIYSDFYPRERLQSAAGLSPGTYFNLVAEIMDYMKQGITLIATDPATNNQVIGIAVNTILLEMDAYDSPTTHRGQRAIMTYLQELQVGHDLFQQFQYEKGVEIYYLGVKEEFGRRGIARRLTEETIRLSRQRNADFVQSFPTSPGTLHLFEQLGFETLSEMKLVDHFLDGQPGFPFAQSADDFARYVAKIL